jgi:fatty acid desaturase
MNNQSEKNLREAEIEIAYEYLRQKDWERMNRKREIVSWITLTIVFVGVAVMAIGAIYLVVLS